ncbi:MAG TPA: hypothetical protein VGS19_26085 [Streptosporangiaceae bacterium]|nr:hypothetical protein [Streptosporangiaceae bacterium]
MRRHPVQAEQSLHVTPEFLEVLLTSPAANPPPAPFTVAPGREGMCWQLTLPSPASLAPGGNSEAGDLLPGLVTAGLSDAGGYILLDLEHLQVTACSGPEELAGRMLATMAAELATSQLAGWYDLILVSFPELAIDGRAESVGTLDEALDLLDARATELAGQIIDAGPGDIRLRRAQAPDGWDLTLLVSRTTPTDQQMTRLLDLTRHGGIAVLIPAPGHARPSPRASIELTPNPDGGISAVIMPLELRVTPQPLTSEDYHGLVTLFSAAAATGDVSPDDPPYRDYAAPTWQPFLAAPPVAAAPDLTEPTDRPDHWDEPEPPPVSFGDSEPMAALEPDLATRNHGHRATRSASRRRVWSSRLRNPAPPLWKSGCWGRSPSAARRDRCKVRKPS